MLSDQLTQLRDQILPLVPTAEVTTVFLTFRMAEMEARSMEDRIHYLTGVPHSPLYGHLMSSTALCEIGGRS